MKRIFKQFRYIAVAVLALNLSSCDAILDDELTDFGTGPNFVGFAGASLTLSAETNGEEFPMEVPLRIIGPSVPNLDNDVTVTIAVDPSSTAVEGVHYRLNSTTVVLTPGSSETDMYTTSMPITILTAGLQAPLDNTPVLVLNITDATTNENVVVNDKTDSVSINLAYSCPFDVENYAGTYIATTDEFGIYIGATLPFEVIAGPGENQITLVNAPGHPEAYNLVIDVNPANGNLTIPRQQFLNYNNFGATQYGTLSIEGSGTSGATAGNCIGEFGFDAGYFVSAGTFGNYALAFERVETDTPAEGDGAE